MPVNCVLGSTVVFKKTPRYRCKFLALYSTVDEPAMPSMLNALDLLEVVAVVPSSAIVTLTNACANAWRSTPLQRITTLELFSNGCSCVASNCSFICICIRESKEKILHPFKCKVQEEMTLYNTQCIDFLVTLYCYVLGG